MLVLRRIYAAGLTLGLLLNGYLYLAWFREPPNPDRVGYWFGQFFFVFPALGIIALASLIHARSLRLGLPVLIYVALGLIIANQSWLFAWVYPWIAFEQLYVLLWLITSVAFSVAGFRAVWSDQAPVTQTGHHAQPWAPNLDTQTRWRRAGDGTDHRTQP
jgi:hypothetical protein